MNLPAITSALPSVVSNTTQIGNNLPQIANLMYSASKLGGLFNILAQNSPTLLNAISTPYNTPGYFTDGEYPLEDYFGNTEYLKSLNSSGYNMADIEKDMNKFNYLDNTDAAIQAIRNAYVRNNKNRLY